MSTKRTRAEKRTDRTARPNDRAEAIAHDAQYLGRDARGVHHFWSIYQQTVIVIDGDEEATIALPATNGETRIDDLGDWVDYVGDRRGDWKELYLTSSTADHLVGALDQ